MTTLAEQDPDNTLATKREIFVEYRGAVFPVMVKDAAEEINFKLAACAKSRAIRCGLSLLMCEPVVDDKAPATKVDEAVWRTWKVRACLTGMPLPYSHMHAETSVD